MKLLNTWLCAVLIGNAQLFSQPTAGESVAGFYALQDYRYFKAMLADIRRPTFHTRIYCDEAVKFSNRGVTGKHKFWDVAYGGFFPMLGYNFEGRPAGEMMTTKGAALFIEASAHMLLDFDTPSADVINTDFRIGAGVAARPFRNVSWRYKFFHESTHIGDEYTLTAAADSLFRRYNVSYEAHELFLAFDHYRRQPQNFLDFAGLRFYAGGRRLNSQAFEDFRDRRRKRALKAKDKNEWQLGGEIFLFGTPLPASTKIKFGDYFKRIIKPQYFVVAADFYRRDKYAVETPRKAWSYNFAAGLIYGAYLEGQRSTKLLINYYRGVNPHGQLRMDEISYLGLDYSIDF